VREVIMIGNQVYLRILELSDIVTTQRWINDPEISEIMGYLPVKSLKQQEQWYQTLVNDNTRYVFAICLREKDQHIGNVALGNIDYVNRNAMFSIFIYDKQYRGRGLGLEATHLILDFAFDRLNLHKVYLRTSEEFAAAIKMYEKMGFVKEGVMREQSYFAGKYRDKILYSMLENEYRRHYQQNVSNRGSIQNEKK